MLHPDIEVGPSRINGLGLIAKKFIPKGTLICRIDQNDVFLSYEELMELPPDVRKLACQHTEGYVLARDGSEHMNHSCDPNTVCLGDLDMIAVRDIQPGEEVTYDYATSELDENLWPAWECNCGAPNCRKIITVRDCLDPEFQKRYAGYLPSWIVEFIQQHPKS